MAPNDSRASDHGRTRSLWQETHALPEFPPLRDDLKADICVVGSGIAGLTTAYRLARAGRPVVLIDKTGLAGGETSYTTAHLTNALDDRYFHMRELHGAEGARQIAASHSAAIDWIERTIADEKIECDFVRVAGYLFEPPGEATKLLADELKAAHEAGLDGVMRVDRAPLAVFDTGPSLKFPHQAQFHPLAYAAGLARAIETHGDPIFTHTRAIEIEPEEGSVTVETEGGPRITASELVIATGAPIFGPKELAAKQAAYQSYVVVGLVPRGSVVPALLWDTGESYHYVRTLPHASLEQLYLIVGGEDHKTGQLPEGADPFARLEQWTRERFPDVDRFVHRWSGEVMETMDGIGLLGRVPGHRNVYVITGDSGMGMTHATIGGRIVSDLILGRDNAWAGLYDPARKRGLMTGDFFRETFNVAKQYVRPESPEVEDMNLIPRGAGAIVKHGKEKIAVYRDEQGHFHQLSAKCTHLGCAVAWNGTEQTWDCPCHGSRFDRLGSVIHGPAVTALESVQTPELERSKEN